MVNIHMSTLTESLVLSKTHMTNINEVKMINFWGCDIHDVSVVRRLRKLEVAVLSNNHLTSLADFTYCPQLTELYVRKNDIKDINEVLNLSHLPFLRTLWLDENPCSNIPNYRRTVLRMLPTLKKLDNIDVTAEELALVAQSTFSTNVEQDIDKQTPYLNSTAAHIFPPEYTKQEIKNGRNTLSNIFSDAPPMVSNRHQRNLQQAQEMEQAVREHPKLPPHKALIAMQSAREKERKSLEEKVRNDSIRAILDGRSAISQDTPQPKPLNQTETQPKEEKPTEKSPLDFSSFIAKYDQAKEEDRVHEETKHEEQQKQQEQEEYHQPELWQPPTKHHRESVADALHMDLSEVQPSKEAEDYKWYPHLKKKERRRLVPDVAAGKDTAIQKEHKSLRPEWMMDIEHIRKIDEKSGQKNQPSRKDWETEPPKQLQPKETPKEIVQTPKKPSIVESKNEFKDSKQSYGHIRSKENLLCAVFALLREMDDVELKFLRGHINQLTD